VFGIYNYVLQLFSFHEHQAIKARIIYNMQLCWTQFYARKASWSSHCPPKKHYFVHFKLSIVASILPRQCFLQ